MSLNKFHQIIDVRHVNNSTDYRFHFAMQLVVKQRWNGNYNVNSIGAEVVPEFVQTINMSPYINFKLVHYENCRFSFSDTNLFFIIASSANFDVKFFKAALKDVIKVRGTIGNRLMAQKDRIKIKIIKEPDYNREKGFGWDESFPLGKFSARKVQTLNFNFPPGNFYCDFELENFLAEFFPQRIFNCRNLFSNFSKMKIFCQKFFLPARKQDDFFNFLGGKLSVK
ncbi:hypothetical protein PVAND_003492 [Polypedilum vanderplanki]|uniref:Uncharacterized protein n=1 Tax=Polypedilum vanderplanki TaxID=319348 RepID=A0A9J6BW00_POLVA|nr:hypothetical protein PVAND_003492 [Polypedilum vanderplanki]